MARQRRQATVVCTVRMPADWRKRIERMKHADESAAEFIRRIIHAHIDTDKARPLSVPESWGGDKTR